MALPSIRYEYRIALSHVDRNLQLDTTVIAARHPSETAEHLTLRVLALCLLYRDGLAFGPGLCDGDASDLEARDPGGDVTLWAECGAVEAAKLRRIVQQNARAEVHVVLADERRRRELQEGIAALPHGIRDAERVVLWHVDPALVAALARHEERRQRWTVTIVDGHLYIEANGESVDGEAAAGALLTGQ
jgi:uncharacterized protein YaeQ